jgi:predicted RNA-binding protein
MCQATVYILEDGQQREVMRDVAHLVVVEGGVRLEQLFEEPRILPGRIAEIDFLKHRVYLIPSEAKESDGKRP